MSSLQAGYHRARRLINLSSENCAWAKVRKMDIRFHFNTRRFSFFCGSASKLHREPWRALVSVCFHHIYMHSVCRTLDNSVSQLGELLLAMLDVRASGFVPPHRMRPRRQWNRLPTHVLGWRPRLFTPHQALQENLPFAFLSILPSRRSRSQPFLLSNEDSRPAPQDFAQASFIRAKLIFRAFCDDRPAEE